MNYRINLQNKNIVWTEDSVKMKLESLGNLSGKKVAWIQSDLNLKKSCWLTRLIWSLIAKHFAWMRRYFYGVNLKVSSSLLQQLSTQITTNADLVELYNHAISKFKTITPKHAKPLEPVKLDEEVIQPRSQIDPIIYRDDLKYPFGSSWSNSTSEIGFHGLATGIEINF